MKYFCPTNRPSMFPPLVPPTERKVSIAGDLVFEQPIKVHAPVKTKKEEFKEMLIGKWKYVNTENLFNSEV